MESPADAGRLLTLAETLAGLGYWRSDRSRNNFSWSPQMYRILGIAPDAAPGPDLFRAHYHPDDLDKVEFAVGEAARTGTMPPTRFRWIRPDGRLVHIEVAAQREGEGEMIGILRDVTEEVEGERALIAARDQARAAERTKAEMLEVMSHEIRTPMHGVLTAIDQLRRDPSDAQRAALLANLSQGASTVMSVVDDMLDYTRVEAGRVVIESINFDLKSVVRTTVDLFNGTAAAKGLSLDVHGLDGDPAILKGDPARLQQLLSNLIGNAIKFTETGSVSVGLSPTRSDDKADYWMIIVRDSGQGLGEEALGRIFSRSEQADAARLRMQGRTGLGLAISQQLAEAMGGSIAVASDPGKGTTFSVELPFKRADADAVRAAAEAVPTGPMRILLAEDNPINRRLMAGLLTREGHQVVAVEDGRKALGAISGQPFDLILMDMQMPELDGIAATRAIRSLDPPASNTPILAISADSAPERRRVYFDAGIDSFLPKPIVSAQLLEMIAKMRRKPTGPDIAGGDSFNRERLNVLVENAGYEDAAVLMKMLLFDVSDRPQRIGAAVRGQAWELAAAEAEALRSLLDSFGTFSLSRLLAAIGRQCTRHECPPALLDELFEQAKALAALLHAEFGSVPSAIAHAIDNVVEPDFGRRKN
ncbi:ATP-binding protein [Rhizorhabdus dicambivorans]|uniref:histidine kinase n=1 Tax=Rhizorhabdus dicambivorans TaxID=1850238 RepID=A0A2A4G1H9_9SPHN|nr:ATP-binding protein [Rhizorhabdus dicambivorans]ATE63419.1 hybrid sensor histidine kinase/response regulator [Rhizorhabdus dicambivorans]PCE43637.1 hybrid sensor histidine kinase/response regulator [Rhizorhabdus dicambivorans]